MDWEVSDAPDIEMSSTIFEFFREVDLIKTLMSKLNELIHDFRCRYSATSSTSIFRKIKQINVALNLLDRSNVEYVDPSEDTTDTRMRILVANASRH